MRLGTRTVLPGRVRVVGATRFLSGNQWEHALDLLPEPHHPGFRLLEITTRVENELLNLLGKHREPPNELVVLILR